MYPDKKGKWHNFEKVTDVMAQNSTSYYRTLTINPVRELLQRMLLWSLRPRAARTTFTEAQLQSVAFDSRILSAGVIISSKHRRNNIQVQYYNHVGTTQVTGNL